MRARPSAWPSCHSGWQSRSKLSSRFADLQERLEAAADPRAREWWERYLKGEARFRGTKMADVRRIVREWWPPDGDVELACRLIEEPITEDKLAGILALGEILHTGDLERFERLFGEGHIHDWGVCDWFCVKVLGPMVQRAENPLPLAKEIAAWRNSEPIWQRRASVVAFVNLVPRPEEHFRGFVELVLDTCETITRNGKERFVQTGAGWVLRELRRASPDEVDAWLARYGELLTADARQSLKPRARRRGRRANAGASDPQVRRSARPTPS